MRTSAEIQADLDAAYAARRTALFAQSYSLDTGQGRQQVQRANLSDINKLIRDLENELETAQSDAAGNSGILAGNFVRR
jgi:hypothetical protein